MKLSRNVAVKIHFLLDQLLPPVLRDAKWFLAVPFKLLFNDKAKIFLEFKERSFTMSEAEFIRTYRDIKSVLMRRETDLNKECLEEILNTVVGSTVLEVGCGRGMLAKKLSENYRVTALDIIIDPQLIAQYPTIRFREASVEKLPFPDRSFDTVICSHTLEHVQNLCRAIRELRRVARKRLILVVPKQRPYHHTFDLHLHFFPYVHSFLILMGNPRGTCREIGGDLFYFEDFPLLAR